MTPAEVCEKEEVRDLKISKIILAQVKELLDSQIPFILKRAKEQALDDKTLGISFKITVDHLANESIEVDTQIVIPGQPVKIGTAPERIELKDNGLI